MGLGGSWLHGSIKIIYGNHYMAFREDHTMFLGNFTLKVVEIIDRQVMRLGVG